MTREKQNTEKRAWKDQQTQGGRDRNIQTGTKNTGSWYKELPVLFLFDSLFTEDSKPWIGLITRVN